MNQSDLVECFCCGRLVSGRTHRDHAASAAHAQANLLNDENGEAESPAAGDIVMTPADGPASSPSSAPSPIHPPQPQSTLSDEMGVTLDDAGEENSWAPGFHPPDWAEEIVEVQAEPPAWPDPDDEEWDTYQDEGRGVIDPTLEQQELWDLEWLEEAQSYCKSFYLFNVRWVLNLSSLR